MVVVPEISPQVPAELADRAKALPVDQVGLQRVKERLHVSVLVGSAAARHALARPVMRQAATEGPPEKLAASIAVEDQSRGWSSSPEGGFHCRTRETRVADRTEPPGEHPPRVLVQHGHQIPPATTDPDVGHVSHPDLIRSAGSGSLHAIRVPSEPPMRPRLAPVDARAARSPASHAHQPLDAPAADPMTALAQRPMPRRAAVGPPAVMEDPGHGLEQNPVLFLACTRGGDDATRSTRPA